VIIDTLVTAGTVSPQMRKTDAGNPADRRQPFTVCHFGFSASAFGQDANTLVRWFVLGSHAARIRVVSGRRFCWLRRLSVRAGCPWETGSQLCCRFVFVRRADGANRRQARRSFSPTNRQTCGSTDLPARRPFRFKRAGRWAPPRSKRRSGASGGNTPTSNTGDEDVEQVAGDDEDGFEY